MTLRVNYLTPSKDPLLSGDEVNRIKKIIQDVLTMYYADLDALLKKSIKSIAVDMYSHGLISEPTKDAANFNDMMREFKSGMNFIRDGQKLVKHCELFLQSLAKQRGPPIHAARGIAEVWIEHIHRNLNLCIKFDIE